METNWFLEVVSIPSVSCEESAGGGACRLGGGR